MGEFIDPELEHDGIVSGQIRDFTRRYGFLTPIPGSEIDGLPSKFTFTCSGNIEDIPEDPTVWQHIEGEGYKPIGKLSDQT